MPFPVRVQRAYEEYRYGPPGREWEDLLWLIIAVMDHAAELAELVDGFDVRAAMTQGGATPFRARVVGEAWDLFLIRRPRGWAAAVEARAWMKVWAPDPGPRHRLFVASLYALFQAIG